MRLILIRHAATEGNRHRYVGREDLPLSCEGERQANALAARLTGEHIDAIYSSPLARAVRTAEAIASSRATNVRIRDALMEIDYGTLQGASKATRPFRLRKEYLTEPIPGGESLTDVWQRLGSLCDELLAERIADRKIAVVGHYWSNRILLARLQGMSLADAFSASSYKPTNASALALEFTRSAGNVVSLRSSEWISV